MFSLLFVIVSLSKEILLCSQQGVISHIVLCEVVWVLARAYRYERSQVVEVLQAVLTCQEFVVERLDLAELALLDYREGNADYSDCLLSRLHQSLGAVYTVTFDRKAAASSSRFRLVSS